MNIYICILQYSELPDGLCVFKLVRETKDKSSLLMIVRPSRSRSRHLTLSLSVLVAVVLILSFVEERSDEVKDTIYYVSQSHHWKQAASVSLRADNGSNECSPR